MYTEKWANIRKYAQEQINLTREHWRLTLEYAKIQIRELDKWTFIHRYVQERIDTSVGVEPMTTLGKDQWKIILECAEKPAEKLKQWQSIVEHAHEKVRDSSAHTGENRDRKGAIIFTRDQWEAILEYVKMERSEQWDVFHEYTLEQVKQLDREQWAVILECAKIQIENSQLWVAIQEYAKEQTEKKEGKKSSLTRNQWETLLKYAKSKIEKKEQWSNIQEYVQEQIDIPAHTKENRVSEEISAKSNLTKDQWRAILACAEIQLISKEDDHWRTIEKHAQERVGALSRSKDKNKGANHQRESNLTEFQWKLILEYAKTQADAPQIFSSNEGERWHAIFRYAQKRTAISKQVGGEEKTGLTQDQWTLIMEDAKTVRGRIKRHVGGPYLNAEKLRFGYAITLHRAQGCLFETIIADLSNNTGLANIDYHRYRYTAFSVPTESIYLTKVPRKNPFRGGPGYDFGQSRLIDDD